MVAPILIPFVILGGMDGIEPLCASAPLREIKINSVVRRSTELRGLGAQQAVHAPRGGNRGGVNMKVRTENRARVERGGISLMVRNKKELRGIGAAAKECGVSHTHLRKVLQGERVPSAELQRKMYRLGLYPGMMKA